MSSETFDDKTIALSYDNGMSLDLLQQATGYSDEELLAILKEHSSKYKKDNADPKGLADEMLEIIANIARNQTNQGAALKAAMYIRDECQGRLDKNKDTDLDAEERFKVLTDRMSKFFSNTRVIDTVTLPESSGDASGN